MLAGNQVGILANFQIVCVSCSHVCCHVNLGILENNKVCKWFLVECIYLCEVNKTPFVLHFSENKNELKTLFLFFFILLKFIHMKVSELIICSIIATELNILKVCSFLIIYMLSLLAKQTVVCLLSGYFFLSYVRNWGAEKKEEFPSNYSLLKGFSLTCSIYLICFYFSRICLN